MSSAFKVYFYVKGGGKMWRHVFSLIEELNKMNDVNAMYMSLLFEF